MALPRKLKHLNTFINGENWVGLIESFTPAPLTRKFEAYRGGGMVGAAKVDMGYEDDALDVSFVLGGFEDKVIRQHSGVEQGDQKTSENTQTTVNMNCTYYKVIVDGETIIEIDVLNMIEFINGVDMMEKHRRAIGL